MDADTSHAIGFRQGAYHQEKVMKSTVHSWHPKCATCGHKMIGVSYCRLHDTYKVADTDYCSHHTDFDKLAEENTP